MNAPDVVQKRNEWVQTISKADSDKLVFLDESGVNTDMTRHYGRAVGKERAVDKVPENTKTITTILSSIRLNGETAYTTYSGGTTGERFVEYLEKVLIPTLHEGDIVIMDNMRSHHVYPAHTATTARTFCHTLPTTAHGQCTVRKEPA